MLWVEWFERFKWYATGLDASITFMFAEAICKSSRFFAYCTGYAVGGINGDGFDSIIDANVLLRSSDLTFWMKANFAS